MVRVRSKDVEKGDQLEEISIRAVGKRNFWSNLVRLPGMLRAFQGL